MDTLLISLVRILDQLDGETLENEPMSRTVILTPSVLDEIDRLSETDYRSNLIGKIVAGYSGKDIQAVINYYQTRIRIFSLPLELHDKIIMNLPVKILRIFYTSPVYKKLIDKNLKNIPESVTVSTDEALLNSLICLPMFFKTLILGTISNFTIKIRGKRINNGYLLPVKVDITISTVFSRLESTRYFYSGYGIIDDNRATGNWTLDIIQSYDGRDYKGKLMRIVSLSKPHLLFTRKMDLDGNVMIFNPGEKYYVFAYRDNWSLRPYKYGEYSPGDDIKIKYRVVDIGTSSLDNYPVENKIVRDILGVNLRQPVQGKAGIVRRTIL